MGAWGVARSLRCATESRYAKHDSAEEPRFRPNYAFERGRCYECGTTAHLRTGIIGGVKVLFCPEHEHDYRNLKIAYARTK